MAEDRLKQENQQTLSDKLLELGENALAISAGAILLYRSGGKRYLSDGVQKAGRFLNNAHTEISARSLADWNLQEISNVTDSLKRTWHEIRNDTATRNIDIRTDDMRSMFSVFGDMLRIQKNPKEIISEMYKDEKMIKPTLEHFQNNLTDGDDFFENKMFNFIKALPGKLDDDVLIADHVSAYSFKEHEKLIAEQLVQHMQDLDTFAQRRTFAEANEHILKQVTDLAGNLDNLEREYGSALTKSENYIDKILGDSAATIEDIINNTDKLQETKHFFKENSSYKFEDTINMLNRLRAEYRDMGDEFEQRFLALTPDKNVLRKDKDNNIYSFKEASKMLDSALDFLAGTLPGKLLKLRDFQYNQKTPGIHYIGKSSTDPILAATVEKNTASSEMSEHYFNILNRVYKVASDKLEHIPEADNLKLISGNFGAQVKLLRQIMGHNDYKTSDNALLRTLDIWQDGERNVFENLRSRIVKFDDETWIGNVADKLWTPDSAPPDSNYAVNYLSTLRRFDYFLSKNTSKLGPEAVKKIKPYVGGKASYILEKLLLSDQQLLDSIIMSESSSYGRADQWMKNKNLITLIEKYIKNPKKATDSITLKTDNIGFDIWFNGSYGGDKKAEKFYDILRMELGKEVFLQHTYDNEKKYGKNFAYQAITDLIKDTKIGGKEQTAVKRLAYWAAFQDITNVSTKANHTNSYNLRKIYKSIENTKNLFNISNKSEFHTDFEDTMTKTLKDKVSSTDSYFESRDNVVKQRKYSEYIHMQKAVSPLEVIKSLNDFEKFKATGSKFVKQFNAGRNDPHNITTATLFPYFLFARLSDDINIIGAGFSKQSMGSTVDLAKNIVLKRVMPIGATLTYYEWMDDTVKEVTGTSVTGTFANGLANVDLAYRQVSDTIGLTEFLKEEKSINPIMQYYFGKGAYQDYDERKEYYEKGYDPVRKGRYWTFGGVNEFRGGQIAYFEPSFARRLSSGYKDKSLYDGYWDKWSHSWLPTPTNPLSPLMALLDPYWLENRHMQERPYPISGTLFAEGTLWGVFLNPTIGELIKPQKRMHTDRLEDGIDVKALIHQMNSEVHRKAFNNENGNLIALKNNSIEPVRFVAYNAPTMNERVYSMQFQDQKVADEIMTDYGHYIGGIAPEMYLNQNINNEIIPIAQRTETLENFRLTEDERMQIDQAMGNHIAVDTKRIVKQLNPLEKIGHINRGIILKAQTTRAQGIMIPEKINSLNSSPGAALLDDAETIDELAHISSGDSMIKEAELSARLIAGIYGYGANRLTGFGENRQKRIATSADMDSWARSFWDESFGGIGGNFADVVRRFIPEYKRNTRINPLMNTMPDWLPERFRFGDPFTLLPKGEMRLPGKGYESLNDLHPDQFGDYGSFDRFKILADIAPYSAEYKVWQKIARRTVIDPNLKEEMKEIKARVAEQGKQHDFYNYQFVGRDIEYDTATVTEILDYGKFKIYGSDEIYKLAGVRFDTTGENKNTQQLLNQYLHPGQEITIVTDENEYYKRNNDRNSTISTAVYVGGENLSNKLIDDGVALVRKGDMSAAATVGQYSGFQRLRGYIWEKIAHLDLPMVHDQWLRIRSPLESYKAEQVYGTPYQTWSDITGTYILPAIERAVSDRNTIMVGEIANYLYSMSEDIPGLGKTNRKLIGGAYLLANRGAFIGGILAFLTKPNSGEFILGGAKAGAFALSVGHLYAGVNDPVQSTLGFAHLAYKTAEVIKKPRIASMAIGAAIGLGAYGANNSILDDRKVWIPERTEEKWKLQEYFDRLNYIKYMGLYNKAAREALDEEGVDVEQLIERQEKEAEKKSQLRQELTETKARLRELPDSETRKNLEDMVNEKLQSIRSSQIILRAGPWTQSALLYKQAADSTFYGLKDNATYVQIVRSLPKNDREYFLEFIKERDPEKREDILRTASPFLQRALKKTWGEETDDIESNASYFMNHNLPNFSWSGWRPDVDLADVQVKTIYNEGMLLSDFGYYESQLRDPDVINAPNLNPNGGQDPLTLQANLLATLKGLGLIGVNVSVQPSPMSGIQVVANVARIVEYNVKKTAEDIFRLL